MLTYIRKIMKNDKGFTLIELMVVVVILGVLAAVAIPQFAGKSDTAKENAAKADLKTITNALEMYYFDNEDYPDQTTLGNLSGIDSDLVPGYLKKLPVDPWGNQYQYQHTNNSGSYTLYSTNNGGTSISLQ